LAGSAAGAAGASGSAGLLKLKPPNMGACSQVNTAAGSQQDGIHQDTCQERGPTDLRRLSSGLTVLLSCHAQEAAAIPAGPPKALGGRLIFSRVCMA
jgi:hypothetical protein